MINTTVKIILSVAASNLVVRVGTALVGAKTGRRYRLGDSLRVRVVRVVRFRPKPSQQNDAVTLP